VVLLLGDFAFLDMKSIEDVERFSVCEGNFRLCRQVERSLQS